MRYVVGVIGFLLVATVVAVVVGFVMVVIFPPVGEPILVGIGLNWRNLPGTILGILAGVHSFRASVK